MHPQISRLNAMLDKFRSRVEAREKIDGVEFSEAMISMLTATLLTLESVDARLSILEENSGGSAPDTGRSRF